MKQIIKKYSYWIVLITIIITRVSGLWGTYIVSGESMDPTYKDHQFLITSNIPLLDGVDRGDVVIVNTPEGHTAIKRVIGLPNETITININGVVIDGERLDEDYIKDPYVHYTTPITIILEDDQYWVMGDNREVSKDSRYYGPIEKADIKASILFVF